MGGYSTTCVKRYCRRCLWNWYMEQAPYPENRTEWDLWKCPCCRQLCCCHRCRTTQKIKRGMDMVDMAERSGILSPARCLSRTLLGQDSETPEPPSKKQKTEAPDTMSSFPAPGTQEIAALGLAMPTELMGFLQTQTGDILPPAVKGEPSPDACIPCPKEVKLRPLMSVKPKSG